MDKLAKAKILGRIGAKLRAPGMAKKIGIGAGMAAGAAGAGTLAYKNTPARMTPAMMGGKKSVEFTDKSKMTIRWRTFPGGPILEGPTQIMRELFKVGKANRQQGLTMLKKLLEQGTVRKTGIV